MIRGGPCFLAGVKSCGYRHTGSIEFLPNRHSVRALTILTLGTTIFLLIY